MTSAPSAPNEHPRESVKIHPKRRWWVWVIAAAAALIVVYFVIRHSKRVDDFTPPEPVVASTIKVSAAKSGDIGIYIDALGTVTPMATVNVYSQIAGVVNTVNYTEGQMIHQGDPLIDIDPRPYEAQVEEAQGTLEHDQGLLKEAEIDLARYRDASSQDAISRQTFEDQEQIVAQYKGTVKNDTGQLKYAQVQLSYCHLSSPISGRVGLRLVDPGNTVFSGSSSALVVITQLQPITVVFNVAEDHLEQVRGEIQDHSDLTVDAYDRTQQLKIASGKLLTLDNQIDTTTGTVRFRGQFDNADLKLFPNQFVNARLRVKTLHSATLIPMSAIQRNGVDAFVYRLSGDTAKIQSIKVIVVDGDTAAVAGLEPGDTVALTGFDKLQDGSKVQVQPNVPTTMTADRDDAEPKGGQP